MSRKPTAAFKHLPRQLQAVRQSSIHSMRRTVHESADKSAASVISLNSIAALATPGRRFGIELQPVVMRRCDRQRADFSKLFEHRASQRGAFAGFGTAADFIEKDERAGCRRFQHRLDRQNMRRKRAEMVCDGLLVADIGKDVIENRQSRFFRGNRNSGLRHQRQQPTVFRTTVFPPAFGPLITRIRRFASISSETGDIDHVLAPQIVFEQRMPRLDQG